MKKSLLFFLFAGITLSIISCGSGKPKYKSEAGKFAVRFEGEPKVTSDLVDTKIGPVEVNMFLYEKSEEEVFVVGYSDYPAIYIENQDKSALLKGAQEGVVGNILGTTSDEKPGNFNGNASLEFRAEGMDCKLAYKFILVENRLYQIGIMKYGKDISSSEVEDFIGSFELL